MENKNVSYFTTGDGCKIAYKIEGNLSKPVLVLSNSIATNFTMWDGQIENFSKYYTIIRFDTRGNGLSDAPVGDYSIARMSLDLIELLDYLQIKQVHFCGLSLGGFIGQWLGIHASDRIDKLILVNTAPYLGPAKLWNENIRILNTQPNMNYFEDMFIRGWFSEDMIVNQKEVVLPFRKMILKTSPVGLAGSYAAVRDSDFRKTNSLITNPTLIIAGKYDEVTKPEHSEQINSAIPQSKLVILPVVHLTNIERKIEFEKLVLDFLENI
ncbi:alpha/beta fold hydrolase [Flavobacterium sp. ARAG 55.4]|uniref:alpha/beta fold hydrolase n=1 Tax=Flavobacterium sp. ARAG 55.4 TaxID=3451357 RepID=UPI003F470382